MRNSYRIFLPTAGAMIRSSSMSFANWSGYRDCAPSDSALSGVQCTSISNASAPAATEAREGSWLYIFARDEKRSQAAYPDDWSLMDWPALERLCQLARPPERRVCIGPQPLRGA